MKNKEEKNGIFHLFFLQKVCQFKNLMESKDGRNKKSSEIDSVLRKYEKQRRKSEIDSVSRKYEKQRKKNGIFHLFFLQKVCQSKNLMDSKD